MVVQNILITEETYTHPNWVYKDVYLPFSRLYYVLGGEGYYTFNGETKPFKEGFLYLFPIKKRYSVFNNENNKMNHVYAHIITNPGITDIIEIKVDKKTPLYDAIMLWRKYIPKNDIYLISSIIQLIISLVFQNENNVDLFDNSAYKIKDFIDNYSGYDLTLDIISKNIGYTKTHINRLFNNAFSTSPMKYLNSKKLLLSLDKLKEGMTIKEVSILLNFSSMSAFSKSFKNYFGVSPRNYIETISCK